MAKFSTRGRQQLVLLREAQGGLMMHTLFYADEVRDFSEIDRGESVTLKPGEIDLAVQLIEQLGVDRPSTRRSSRTSTASARSS